MMDADQLRHATPQEEPEGGDPACWAALVCPNCGAIADRADVAEPTGDAEPTADGDGTTGEVRAASCPRCGQPYPLD
jgi:hypothetical protein